jgi:hypothetical protein
MRVATPTSMLPAPSSGLTTGPRFKSSSSMSWRSMGTICEPDPYESGRGHWPRCWDQGDRTLRPVHFISGPPDPLIASVDELGLEGVVAKWEGAPYQGGRTPLRRTAGGGSKVGG